MQRSARPASYPAIDRYTAGRAKRTHTILRAFRYLPPETANMLARTSLVLAHGLGLLPGASQGCSFEWRGLRFANRVGLAAGFDKNGDAIDALAACGFGFVEIGTVTPQPQPGNTGTRLFRLASQHAIINRMGFNNKGVDYAVARLRASVSGIVKGVNIGKNATTPVARAVDDYRHCLDKVYPWCDYIAVNVSSPNTRDLRTLQHGDRRTRLFRTLAMDRARLRDRHRRDVPIVIKIAPDLNRTQITQLVGSMLECGLDGIIATNTTTRRPAILAGVRHASQSGGLSGAPLAPFALDCVRTVSTQLPADALLIGVGGIHNGDLATQYLEAGAQLIQLYTGLVYQGTGLIDQLVKATSHAYS